MPSKIVLKVNFWTLLKVANCSYCVKFCLLRKFYKIFVILAIFCPILAERMRNRLSSRTCFSLSALSFLKFLKAWPTLIVHCKLYSVTKTRDRLTQSIFTFTVLQAFLDMYQSSDFFFFFVWEWPRLQYKLDMARIENVVYVWIKNNMKNTKV